MGALYWSINAPRTQNLICGYFRLFSALFFLRFLRLFAAIPFLQVVGAARLEIIYGFKVYPNRF